MAHEVYQPLEQRLIRIVSLDFDAVLPVVQTKELGGLLHHATQHIEVVRVKGTFHLQFIQFDQCRKVMKKWRAGRVLKCVTAWRRTFRKKVTISLVPKLIAQNIEEQDMVG